MMMELEFMIYNDTTNPFNNQYYCTPIGIIGVITTKLRWTFYW